MVTSSSSNSELNYRTRDFPENRSVYIVAVPKYHENLFKHVKEYHDWLAGSVIDANISKDTNKNSLDHWRKKINSKGDMDKLEQLITDLKAEKSELFIDASYYAKPTHVSIKSYINEFIKSKGIANHYTFSTYYRVSVFPMDADFRTYPPVIAIDEKSGEPIRAPDERQEYLIVPLLIRLKRDKTIDQNKSIHYKGKNEDTGLWDYEVKNINAWYFKKDAVVEDEEYDEEESTLH